MPLLCTAVERYVPQNLLAAAVAAVQLPRLVVRTVVPPGSQPSLPLPDVGLRLLLALGCFNEATAALAAVAGFGVVGEEQRQDHHRQ